MNQNSNKPSKKGSAAGSRTFSQELNDPASSQILLADQFYMNQQAQFSNNQQHRLVPTAADEMMPPSHSNSSSSSNSIALLSSAIGVEKGNNNGAHVHLCNISSMQALKTQCGGHKGMRQGCKGKHATIAKPMPTKRESVFYKKIKSTPLYQCVPKFYGVTSTSTSVYNNSSSSSSSSSTCASSSSSSSTNSACNDIHNNVSNWLLLQDLTAGMQSPCIADLKIGTRTYEVDVPKWKAERQTYLMQGTTTVLHAVRCIDICVRENNNIVAQYDRKQGRSMTWTDLEKAMKVFLSTKSRVVLFEQQLKGLKKKLVETYKVLPNMRLYSASVLVIYDGDHIMCSNNSNNNSNNLNNSNNTDNNNNSTTNNNNNGNNGNNKDKNNKDVGNNGKEQLIVKLIDFGHAYVDVEAEGGVASDQSFDDNALLGIENLLSMAKSILKNL